MADTLRNTPAAGLTGGPDGMHEATGQIPVIQANPGIHTSYGYGDGDGYGDGEY